MEEDKPIPARLNCVRGRQCSSKCWCWECGRSLPERRSNLHNAIRQLGWCYAVQRNVGVAYRYSAVSALACSPMCLVSEVEGRASYMQAYGVVNHEVVMRPRHWFKPRCPEMLSEREGAQEVASGYSVLWQHDHAGARSSPIKRPADVQKSSQCCGMGNACLR